MDKTLRSHRNCSLANRRGAAFLLAVYFVSLTLLLLGGVSLQRTNTEVHSAEVSRDLQQAFWLAEAGLDQALATIRTNSLALGEGSARSSQTGPTGSYTYRVVQVHSVSPDWHNARLELVYDIEATGRTGQALTGRVATVRTTLRNQQTLSDVLVNGHVNVIPVGWAHAQTINGGIRSALGQVNTVILQDGTTIDGDVVISPAAPVEAGGYTNLFGRLPNSGSLPFSTFGVTMLGLSDFSEAVTGGVQANSTGPLPPISIPSICQSASTPLRLIGQQNLEIRDGFQEGDLKDLSAPDDGQVVMCVPSVMLASTYEHRPRLRIHDPTVLYVTGVIDNPVDLRRDAVGTNTAFSNSGGVIKTVPRLGQQSDRGLTVVVTVPPGRSQAGEMLSGNFEGSIYAPASDVRLEAIGPAPNGLKLGFCVSKDLTIHAFSLDFHPRSRRGAAATPSQSAPSVLSWTN